MPIISTFLGIVIRMYYQEHEPAHFHAEYQGESAKFNFDGELIVGSMGSRTARNLVKKWARQHRFELAANWDRMRQGRPLQKIEPLD